MYCKMRKGMKITVPIPRGSDTFLLPKLLARTLPSCIVFNSTDSIPQETGLIAGRGKQITLRPLDKVKLAEQRRLWQLLNLGAPLLLLGAWRRKRRYAGFTA